MAEKTYKREVAALLMLFWAGATTYLYLFADESRIKALESLYFTHTWPTLAFGAGAFGLDWLARQWGSK